MAKQSCSDTNGGPHWEWRPAEESSPKDNLVSGQPSYGRGKWNLPLSASHTATHVALSCCFLHDGLLGSFKKAEASFWCPSKIFPNSISKVLLTGGTRVWTLGPLILKACDPAWSYRFCLAIIVAAWQCNHNANKNWVATLHRTKSRWHFITTENKHQSTYACSSFDFSMLTL